MFLSSLYIFKGCQHNKFQVILKVSLKTVHIKIAGHCCASLFKKSYPLIISDISSLKHYLQFSPRTLPRIIPWKDLGWSLVAPLSGTLSNVHPRWCPQCGHVHIRHVYSGNQESARCGWEKYDGSHLLIRENF